MKTLLILMVSFGLDGGVGNQVIEFKNRTACEQAQKVIIERLTSNDKSHDWGRRNFLVVCIDA